MAGSGWGDRGDFGGVSQAEVPVCISQRGQPPGAVPCAQSNRGYATLLPPWQAQEQAGSEQGLAAAGEAQ